MKEEEFIDILNSLCSTLTAEAKASPFRQSGEFETRVRNFVIEAVKSSGISVEVFPAAQAFPDVVVGRFGIEVKFAEKNTWRSVANSVLESNRNQDVEKVFIVFGKMGGEPEVRWAEYEKVVMHVRTSHVPRFEVELDPAPEHSLFERMGVTYDEFRLSPMENKMEHIRAYARSRLKPGERLWWLEDHPENPEHTMSIQARLYTSLSMEEKTKLRAEAVLLSPKIVSSSRSRDKYNDIVLYLLTYHGVICHQARDLFSAGSVANPTNDDDGGIYIERAIKLLELEMLNAAQTMDEELLKEYWGYTVDPDDRIEHWLRQADKCAKDWIPSSSLFLEYQASRR